MSFLKSADQSPLEKYFFGRTSEIMHSSVIQEHFLGRTVFAVHCLLVTHGCMPVFATVATQSEVVDRANSRLFFEDGFLKQTETMFNVQQMEKKTINEHIAFDIGL